jgi:hypothetical protein
MGVLYVISDRQSALTAFELVLKEDGDVSILLLGEVCRLMEDTEHGKIFDKFEKIYCLEGHEKSSRQIDGVEVINYSGWVKLMEENERIVSWT